MRTKSSLIQGRGVGLGFGLISRQHRPRDDNDDDDLKSKANSNLNVIKPSPSAAANHAIDGDFKKNIPKHLMGSNTKVLRCQGSSWTVSTKRRWKMSTKWNTNATSGIEKRNQRAASSKTIAVSDRVTDCNYIGCSIINMSQSTSKTIEIGGCESPAEHKKSGEGKDSNETETDDNSFADCETKDKTANVIIQKKNRYHSRT